MTRIKRIITDLFFARFAPLRDNVFLAKHVLNEVEGTKGCKGIISPLIFCLMFIANNSFSQQNTIDNLNNLLHTATHDTTKLNILFELVENIYDNKLWQPYNEQALKLAEKLSHSNEKKIKEKGKKGLADGFNNIGFLYDNQGQIKEALDYYCRSLKIWEEIGDKQGIASSLNNIGLIYNNQGQIKEALDYYGRSLKIKEEIGDKKGIAISLSNIGVVYKNQGQLVEALDYYGRSLKIQEEIGDKQGIAISLNNIGGIYKNQKQLVEALDYYGRSLKILEEIGDKQGTARSLNNIGLFYNNQGQIKEALDYYGKSLKILEEIGDKQGIAYSLNNIGYIYLQQKNYSLAFSYSDSSLVLAKEIGYPENIREAAKTYAEIYKATGNYKSGWEMYELYVLMRDSVKNKENEKAAIRQQTKYEFEKALIIKEQEEREEGRRKMEVVARRNRLQYSAIFIGLLVLFSGVFMLGKFHLPVRVVEGSVFMSFLLLFEFILVFLDPFLDDITGGVPLLKLLVNAIIAGIIFPVHGYFESVMKRRLMKSNKIEHAPRFARGDK